LLENRELNQENSMLRDTKLQILGMGHFSLLVFGEYSVGSSLEKIEVKIKINDGQVLLNHRLLSLNSQLALA
jgi:hypothetical protein